MTSTATLDPAVEAGPATFAEAEARLAERLPAYEPRPQQQEFARAVEGVLARPAGGAPRHLLAQAGCGVGKSLGYLIPAVLSGRRVVVSVTTRALQGQLRDVDLPFLQEHLGVEFTWAVLQGRGRYLCVNKLELADEGKAPVAAILRAAEAEGFSGLREDLPVELTDAEWHEVAAEADDCQSNGCRDRVEGCFAEQARARARACRVVVVNHALLFTDLGVKAAGGGGMLDEYDLVVMDEAHEAEEVAGSTLGSQLTEATLRSLTSEARGWAHRYADDVEALDAPVSRLLVASEEFFSALPARAGEPLRLRAASLDEVAEQYEGAYEALEAFRVALAEASLEHVDRADYKRAKARKDRLVRRANATTERLVSVLADSWTGTVRWVEVERTRSGEERKVLRTAPVDVGPYLREHLFSQTPAVLVSATLAVQGRFDHVAGRLGVDGYDGLDVGTPFDFATQAKLYVPTHLPEPAGSKVQVWEVQARQEMVDLIRASRGRALVLFTSTKRMRAAFDAVERQLGRTYPMRKQGDAPHGALLDWFKAETSSVLFATRSFMTGVDVQGESLSLVVVDKMPFPVPTEPLTEARCEAIEARRGNAFNEFTIPVMSLVLQQAAGRLIRHRQDRGCVAILDPRIATKYYGKKIIKDLPPMPRVDSVDAVASFLAA